MYKNSFRHILLLVIAALIVAALGIGLPAQPVYAAGIVVNSNTDDTLANLDANATCDLREAIVNANNDAATYPDCAAGSGVDSISFSADYTITLVDQLPEITTQMTITGNGMDHTIIQANANPFTATYRLFSVSPTGNLNLTDMTIANGRCSATCSGGVYYNSMGSGILNQGYLTVLGSRVKDNNNTGIFNDGYALWVGYSEFTGNYAGAIYNLDSSSTIMYSTFVNNYAPKGAGIRNEYSPLTVNGSTFSNNTASVDGGGIFTLSPATIINSTFFQNTADNGGGLYNSNLASTLTVRNSTFSENSATGTGPVSGIKSLGPVDFANTVIANSAAGADCNAGSLVSSINNLVEDGSCGGGVNFKSGDPGLDMLALHGGIQTIVPKYGSVLIDAGDDAICADPSTVNSLDQRSSPRPYGAHCDIGAYEKDAVFADVPLSYWANDYIERLYRSGITSGCSLIPYNFCPSTPVTRAQMAVFLVRGIHGVNFTPPAATGIFSDVPAGSFAASYIEQLSADGITSGCGGGKFCPSQIVTRSQLAVFLVRAKHGVAFVPAAATGVFTDVPVGSFGADYIEQLVRDGITSGCTASAYCPSTTVKRDTMSVLLVRTFNLP